LIRSKKLAKIKDLKHCFFNSVGGHSKNIYKSLNCGPGSKDNKKNIKKNLQIVRKKISKKAQNIFLVHQIHSNKFIFIDKAYDNKEKPKVDAIITNKKNFPIGVLTADCAPILIYEDKMKMIAAIHAGWKGAFKGIIGKVIKFMIKKGCKLENITAAIGPSISQKIMRLNRILKESLLKKIKKIIYFLRIKKIDYTLI
jgi:YfiH family protein